MTKWLALFLLASTAYGQQVSVTPIPDCSSGFCSGLGVPTFNCNSGQKYAQVDNAGHNFTCTGIPPHWVADAGGGGGANLPTANQVISGDGTGNGVAMPEKGTTLVTGPPNTALVAWDEDRGLGKFDCRDTKYGPGGCLGAHPQQAMQDLADDVTCYQAINSKHANVTFPPGIIPIGTASKTTLTLPTGAYYSSTAPGVSGQSTTFSATYNNVLAMHIVGGTTATCADGNVHTNALTDGRYEGISIHGCGNGGCINVPGDSSNHPFGGPGQIPLLIEDQGGLVDLVGSDHNGGEGVTIGGEDTQVRTVRGLSNMEWYIFGHTQAGQTYNPNTDGLHCNVMLLSLDGTFAGPFETFGFLDTPGAEYTHVCSTLWGGGNTHLGPVFSNRDQTGLVRASGSSNGRAIGGRYDAPLGEGIVVPSTSGGNTFSDIDNSSACSGFASITPGQLFGPWISSFGSGMTAGTYVVPATNAGGDFQGAGGTMTAVVSGGVLTSVTISNTGTTPYLATPTFVMTGTGGTPATFGATIYHHCSYIDDDGSRNSYSNVKNVFESFFGANHSTGFIWTDLSGTGNTFDRGTSGTFERITGIGQTGRGQRAHKDLTDINAVNGGLAVTGPAVQFLNGNHFFSGDSSPTTWSGPFTVESIMQDLWIMGGNANTTLPFANWKSCSGNDTNLGNVTGQTHWIVTKDDVGVTVGTNFVFTEQCDPIFANYLQPGFNTLAVHSVLPATTTQATLDAAGSIAVRPYPAMADPTITIAGTGSSFSYCIVDEVWAGGGKQTSHSVCNAHTPPVSATSTDNFQVHQALPQNWTRFQVRLNSTTDPSFTPGVWYDFTSPNGLPQLASCDFLAITGCVTGSNGLFVNKIVPTDTSVISAPNIGLNMTGTYNFDRTNIPVATTTLGSPGQTQIDPINGILWYATSEDTWKSITLGGGGGGGGLVYNSPTINAIPVVSNAGGFGTVIDSSFSDDGINTFDSENFQLSGNESLQPTGTATGGSNFPSNSLQLLTSYFNGSTAVKTNWNIQASIGTGTLPASSLNFFSPPESPTDSILFAINPSQSATSGANLNSPKLQLGGATWTGSASLPDTWQQQVVEGAGANPTSTLTFTHTGSSGLASVSLPQTTITSGTAGINNGGAQWTGGTSLPGTCNVGDFYSLTNGTSPNNVMQWCFPANTWNTLPTPGAGTFASVQFTGATSGTVTVQAQSVAGTPTITWPTVSGQVALTTAEVVTWSATPTFTSGDTMSRMVLTGNVTSFTMGATASGSPHTLCFKQGSSSFTVTPPANVHGFTPIGTTSAKWNCQDFMYDASDAIWLATGPGVQNQ